MREVIAIELPDESSGSKYDIVIGTDLLDYLGEIVGEQGYSQVALLTDSSIAGIYADRVHQSFSCGVSQISIPPGEESKSLISYDYILNKLAEAKLDRSSLILNLGGGVIGDLGGFVASTYMRGIDFIQIPTTLLSQVDASVGGKTAINFAGVKNLVGAFCQPKKVIIDVNTLTTLPPRELRSGFAEVLKHGFIASEDYLHQAVSLDISDVKGAELVSLVKGSCEIKARVVQADEKETGLRKILNFGHTFGHAYESLSHEGVMFEVDGPLHHGEAVALGMIAESYLSFLSQNISFEDFQKIEKIVRDAGFPTRAPAIDEVRLMDKMKSDKKNTRGEIRWTLLSGIGSAIVDQVLSEEHILKALKYMRDGASE